MRSLTALLLTAGLAACAAGAGSNPGLTQRQAVVVAGQTYDVGQLTESTWSAIARPPASAKGPADVQQRTALLQEIERVSKCRVTASDYSRDGQQLDAQVDCARRLQN